MFDIFSIKYNSYAYLALRHYTPIILGDNGDGDVPLDVVENDIDDEPLVMPADKHIEPLGRSDMYQMYMSILLWFLLFVEKMTAIYKKIPKSDNEDYDNIDQITREEIKPNEFYYKCEKCAKIFSQTSLHTWYNHNKSYSFSCPHCTTQMKKFPQLYRNSNRTIICIICKLILKIFGYAGNNVSKVDQTRQSVLDKIKGWIIDKIKPLSFFNCKRINKKINYCM